MDNLVLESIVEKLTSIEERIYEISKMVAERNTYTKDLNQVLSDLEADCKKSRLPIQFYSPISTPSTVSSQQKSKFGFELFPPRTLPHLISKSALAVLSLYLTVGLRFASPAISPPLPTQLKLPIPDKSKYEIRKKPRKSSISQKKGRGDAGSKTGFFIIRKPF